MADKKTGCFTKIVAGMMLIGACSMIGKSCGKKNVAKAPAASSSAAPDYNSAWLGAVEADKTEANRPKVCVLEMRDAPSDPLWLFPTEEGFDEFVQAAASGDDEALAVVRRANGGFIVQPGARCTILDYGLMGKSRVRVVSGPHAGKAGYVVSAGIQRR